MIQTTLDGNPVFLFEDRPNMAKGFDVTFSQPLGSAESLTKREARRSFGATLRASIKFSVALRDSSLRAALGRFRALEDQSVLMPFWPAVSSWANRLTAPISGGLHVAFKFDWSQWEIYTSVEPGWVLADDLTVPLLVGFINDPKQPTALNPDMAVAQFEFTESGKAAYALEFDAATFDDGPTPDGYLVAPKLLPFVPNYDRPQAGFEIKIERADIGFSRNKFATFYSHEPSESQKVSFVLSGAAKISSLLDWFQRYAGPGASFWTQSLFAAGHVSVAALSGVTSITLTDVLAVQDNDYLTAIKPDLSYEVMHVAGIAGNVLTLEDPTAMDLPAGQMLRRLFLTKLRKPSIRILWNTNAFAIASVDIVEVKPEQLVPGDESVGETIGQLLRRCYLYDLFWTLDGVTTHERSTSFESAMTLAGNSYAQKDIGHGSIRQSLQLDADKVDVTIALPDSAIAQKMARLANEAPVFLKITQCDVDVDGVTAINPVVIFYGECLKPEIDGSISTTPVVSGGTKFDRGIPRPNLQRDCNASLFDLACSLDITLWTLTAIVSDPGAAGYPFTFDLDTLTPPMGFPGTVGANWFAGGWIQFGTGANTCRRSILLSTNPVAGALTVTLDGDPSTFPAIGDSVKLFPGCDGQFSTCVAKFNNLLNFHGFPFMPAANPTLVKKNQTGAGGKK